MNNFSFRKKNLKKFLFKKEEKMETVKTPASPLVTCVIKIELHLSDAVQKVILTTEGNCTQDMQDLNELLVRRR